MYQNLFFGAGAGQSRAFEGRAGAYMFLPGAGAKKKISESGAEKKMARLRNDAQNIGN